MAVCCAKPPYLTTGSCSVKPLLACGFASNYHTLTGLGMSVGARAPDRLEMPSFNRRTKVRNALIPHRTVTHWPPFWVILTTCTWLCVHSQNSLFNAMASVGLGFCASDWLHLAMGIIIPSGIPLITPIGC
jgi:hypothetical protein